MYEVSTEMGRLRAGASRWILMAALVLGLGTAFVTPSRAATIVVRPGDLSGWEIANYDNSTASEVGDATTTSGTDGDFVQIGPGIPPAGIGSFGQTMGTDGNDATRLRTSAYNGKLLTDITTLTYYTYVTSYGSGGQATYLQLRVDWDNDGIEDDQIFFEPVYQDGNYGVPNQGTLTLNTWQQWDALIGGWWSNADGAFPPPANLWSDYLAAHPGAKLTQDVSSLRLQAGFGAPDWNNFQGAFDDLEINDGTGDTTYDFEGPVVPVELSKFRIE